MKHTSAPLSLGDVGFAPVVEACPECEAEPGAPHASWCLHDEAEEVDEA